MGQYGDLYGPTLYGPDISAQSTSAAVRKDVGKKYDIALAGVGLQLAPGQKAYSKKSAQTFSYNVRSLFSSATRLTARDLYFWNRLEHNRWDKGETYEPWAPDSTTPTGFPSTYYSSIGFDTSQPHKLVHLKEMKHVQTYSGQVVVDGPAQFWPLNDRVGNTTLANLITGTTLTLGSTASLGSGMPLYMDASTPHTSDGTSTGVSLSAAQGALPGTFSLECWVRPRVLNVLSDFIAYSVQQSSGVGIGIGNGSNGAGSKLAIRIINWGWVDTGYTFPTENAWYHVVVTRDGTTLRAYVNGVQTVNTSVQAPTAGTANIFSVGGTFDTGYFKGDVAMFAYYTTQLSLGTIQAHYNLGSNNANAAAQITPSTQTYAQFIETYDSTLYINQQNSKVIYSTDGGTTWSSTTLPDATTIAAMWSDGPKIYVATANDTYYGNSAGITATWRGANPAVAGVTAGWYDGAQIYVGIGTSLYYVDPATGIKTQLYDTKNFTIKWIRGFNNKIWFGGTGNTGGRFSRIWTWTNNTLPPSPANGSGSQVSDGSLPNSFITTAATVYQGLLVIGGFFPFTSGQTNDGIGAAYYVNSANAIGQLFIVGSNTTGRTYQINNLFGDGNFIYCNYNHKLGLGRYDLSKGAFSTAHTIQLYPDNPANQVLSGIVHKGRRVFAVQVDGTIWREQTNPVATATLQESEFQEIMFLPKMVDAIEGSHKALLSNQTISIDISSDNGATWLNKGINSQSGLDHFEFKQVNLQLNHWSSRLNSNVGADATQSPEIYNWSLRFSPIINPKHEWIIECVMPRAARFRDNSVLYDVDLNKVKTLWSARETGTVVEYIDRDLVSYKVLILEMEELKATDRMTKATAQQSRDAIIKLELIEVSST